MFYEYVIFWIRPDGRHVADRYGWRNEQEVRAEVYRMNRDFPGYKHYYKRYTWNGCRMIGRDV